MPNYSSRDAEIIFIVQHRKILYNNCAGYISPDMPIWFLVSIFELLWNF
jgi:hypothetical protein